MNGSLVAIWTLVGLAAGTAGAPAASWLAGVAPHWRYRVLIAGVTTTAFPLIAFRCSTWFELLMYSVFAAVAVQLAMIDVLVRRLPRSLIWPTCMAVAGILVAETIRTGDAAGLLRACAAAAALATSYVAVAIVSQGGLGAGDVRLAVLVGGVLGWHGWPALITGTALGFACTGVVAGLHAKGRRTSTALPHGPGMVTGAFIALML
jgi:leader peptidase (prepilin peptidase)/N-methyltransferase